MRLSGIGASYPGDDFGKKLEREPTRPAHLIAELQADTVSLASKINRRRSGGAAGAVERRKLLACKTRLLYHLYMIS